MPTIQRLPDQLINQIAAGEAVERPASVVKELVENALDAGATAIDITVEQGGRRRIRVEDDGCGMTPGDARLALERHATSKIHTAEDLVAIHTLGFRGEALPAIASVSRLELVTTTRGGTGGHRLSVEGGSSRESGPHPHPAGTTVEVRDLFFNTPARAKFLRTVPTELSRITEVVQAAALAQPGCRFRLTHDGREVLATGAEEDRRERIRRIFGCELAAGLRAVEGGRSPLAVRGYVSGPAFSRANRSHWFLFVNGRPVGDRTLTHAVTRACRPRFPRDRFPAVFLFLEVPAAEVDVNVHPTKREVRFRTPGAVHDLVERALEEALGPGPVQDVAPRTPERAAEGVTAAVEDYLTRRDSPRWSAAEQVRIPAAPATPRPRTIPEAGEGRRVLGQLRDVYILVEEEGGLLLVDQHAAHERALYDRYRQELASGRVSTQPLLFPATVELSPAEMERLTPRLESLRDMGFLVEPFGRDAMVVREVPARLSGLDPVRALRELAGGGTPLDQLEHEMAALGACHAAVRAGMRLDVARMGRIVGDLLEGGHALTCPHGRPAVLRYPLAEIERAFLRPPER